MHFVAAAVAFVVAYFVASLAYGELTPEPVAWYFRDRPALLGLAMLTFCCAVAVATFVWVP